MALFAALGGIASAQITDLETSIRDDKTVTTEKQDSTKWKWGGMFGLNASQATFTNWAAGGSNSVGGNAMTNLWLNFVGNTSSWENTLDLGYGLLYQESDGLRKTDDKIDFSSKYGYKASKHWYYAAMLNFKTQFSEGYNYPNDSVIVSNFMAPGYLIGAIGMDYKPHKVFTAFISPVTAKMTFVLDNTLSEQGAFGVEKGEKFRLQCGGYLRLVYNQSFLKNSITIISKLDLFSNYYSNSGESAKPQNIDVNWENIISFKINKYISANINTLLIYDDDIKMPTGTKDSEGKDITKGPKLQFKEVVGIGLSYKF
ncbi:MAG: DUF3078 domain-containing protein [Paludibacteraceae bacterium]|nr:DUF3078 domain-containing protein [Paludibacteraceae bacterium]